VFRFVNSCFHNLPLLPRHRDTMANAPAGPPAAVQKRQRSAWGEQEDLDRALESKKFTSTHVKVRAFF
jgi:hypothetical protein